MPRWKPPGYGKTVRPVVWDNKLSIPKPPVTPRKLAMPEGSVYGDEGRVNDQGEVVNKLRLLDGNVEKQNRLYAGNTVYLALLAMSDKAPSAVNQQGSRAGLAGIDPSETTRRTPPSREEIIAYLQGALHDGTFSSNKRFRISQKGTAWLRRMRSLLRRIGYSSWIYQEGKTRDVYILETLADFLDFSFDPLQLNTEQAQVGYIRGFFDAEGGIPHSSSARFYIQLCQKNEEKMKKLSLMLQRLGIACGKMHNPSKRVDPDYWRIFIRSASHADFIRTIGSWHPRKIRILERRKMI